MNTMLLLLILTSIRTLSFPYTTIGPACIILDVNIPGRSGLDILKELSAEDYPASIFVISGGAPSRPTNWCSDAR